MRNDEKWDIALALVASKGYCACSREASDSANLTRGRVCEVAHGDEGCRCARENPDVNLLDRADFGRVKGVRDG